MNSFWNILEHIRQKPPEARMRASFIVAACFTFVVSLIWVSTLPAQFSEISKTASEASVGSSINSIKEKVQGGVNSIPTDRSQEVAVPAVEETPVTPTRGPDANATSSWEAPSTEPQRPVMIETVTTTRSTSKSIIMVSATST